MPENNEPCPEGEGRVKSCLGMRNVEVLAMRWFVVYKIRHELLLPVLLLGDGL